MRHQEYQDKLNRFKDMQENELGVSTKLREENKMLRNDNDALRDEILELKQRLNDSKKINASTFT